MATPRTPREDLHRHEAGLPPQQIVNPTPSSDRDIQDLHPTGVSPDTLEAGKARRAADATQSRQPIGGTDLDDDDLQAPDFGGHGGR